jgi:hypothetical protein
MTQDEVVKLGLQLVAIAGLIGPAVEAAITFLVWLLGRWGIQLPPPVKLYLAGLLSIGGSAAIAGGMGWMPWMPWHTVWVASIFGLAAWLVAHANHKASVANG